jgi:integrase/recombinase XerC
MISEGEHPMKLTELLDRFLKAKEAAGLSPKTLTWYSDQVGLYLRWLGENSKASSPEAIDEYLAHQRGRGLAPMSVDACYRALRAMFGWAIRRKLIKASPIADIERPRLPSARARYVTPEAFRQLLDSIDGITWHDYRDRCILPLLYWSGLRVGELIALTVGDIDRDHHLVLVRRGKGGKDRIVPCHPDIAAALDEYLAHRPYWEGPELWLSHDGHYSARGPLTAEGVRQMLRRRCKANGLRHINPHQLRHGFAMAFLNAGMGMSAVAATMGHSSVRVTESTYARWLTGPLQREYSDALARMER